MCAENLPKFVCKMSELYSGKKSAKVVLEPQSLRGSQHRCNTVKLLADFFAKPSHPTLGKPKIKKEYWF
jgi:hypothetical protein